MLVMLMTAQFEVLGQIRINGIVLDVQTRKPLPFVNIGIRNKNVGCASDDDGKFSILIPELFVNDTLTFSMVGYADLELPVKKAIELNAMEFEMRQKAEMLRPVIISGRKFIEKKIGITKSATLFDFLDGSTNQHDIFEIAQLTRLNHRAAKITSVNLHVNDDRRDSGIFRINFYSYDGHMPSKRIVNKNIIQVHAIRDGWLKFDLSREDIRLDNDFVVGIEFIPPKDTGVARIYYEVKLGGPAKSFVRTASQGSWAIPPHHYRLFVTALLEDDTEKGSKDTDDERESVPLFRMYSEFVRDSFSIFVHLPQNYDGKKKKYPVVYVLDGNAYFDNVAGILKDKRKEAILVGIGYHNVMDMDSLRQRDYTFPKAGPNDTMPVSGGAVNFLRFIQEELVTKIDHDYSTLKGKRMLMGHSLGGYFCLYAFLSELHQKEPGFSAFVVASPSLNYCNRYLLDEFGKITNHQNHENVLLISFGEGEDKEDGLITTENTDNFNSFISIMSKPEFKNTTVTPLIFKNYYHMETAMPTFIKGIEQVK